MIPWCTECLMELKKYDYDDDRYWDNLDSLDAHSSHRVIWYDPDSKQYKKLKGAVKRYQKKVVKFLQINSQQMLRQAYSKPNPDEFKEFFG